MNDEQENVLTVIQETQILKTEFWKLFEFSN